MWEEVRKEMMEASGKLEDHLLPCGKEPARRGKLSLMVAQQASNDKWLGKTFG
jgi:hypothetical protein